MPLALAPREREGALPSPAHRILIECLTRVRLADPRSLSGQPGDWHRTEIGEALQKVLRDLPRMSDAIAVSYFAHSSTSRAGGGAA